MTIPALPGVDLVPSVSSRIVTIDAVTLTEGKPVAGDQAWVEFILPTDLHVRKDGKIITASRIRVPLAGGKGSVRLPTYDPDAVTAAGDTDWGIIVRKGWGGQHRGGCNCGHTQDGTYLIRVPSGGSEVSLATIPAVRPLRGRERHYGITGVGLTVTEGKTVSGTASLTGGVLNLDLTIPRGEQGLPGPGATAADDAVAKYVASDSKTSKALDERYRRGYSPREFGIVGDGKTDDTKAWNEMLDVIQAGATVNCPPGDRYKLSGPVNAPKPVEIIGGHFLPHSTGRCLDISASNVTVRDATFESATADPPDDSHQIIAAVGMQGAPLRNILIQDCVIDKTRYHGVWLEWCEDIKVRGVTITDFQYGAVMLISVRRAEVSGCVIRNGLQGGNIVNTYGITATDLANSVSARSTDVVITGNLVDNIPRWEGIDTHGGDRITITNNIVTRCYDGIAAVAGNDRRVTAPRNVVISGNTIDAMDVDARSAIRLYGVNGGEKASAAIGPNIIRGKYVLEVEAKNYESTTIQAQATAVTGGYSSHPAPYRAWVATTKITRNGDNVTRKITLPAGVFTQPPMVFLTPQNGNTASNTWSWKAMTASKDEITIQGFGPVGAIELDLGIYCVQMTSISAAGTPQN